MTDTPTAAQIAAFLKDEENVESLTEAVRELSQICLNGTSDRPPVGIQPLVSAGSAVFLAAENNPEFDSRYLGRWQIGLDLGGDNND